MESNTHTNNTDNDSNDNTDSNTSALTDSSQWWSTSTNQRRHRSSRNINRARHRRAASAVSPSSPFRAISPSVSVPTSPTLAPVSELGDAALELQGLQSTFNRLMTLSRELNADFAADIDDRH